MKRSIEYEKYLWAGVFVHLRDDLNGHVCVLAYPASSSDIIVALAITQTLCPLPPPTPALDATEQHSLVMIIRRL